MLIITKQFWTYLDFFYENGIGRKEEEIIAEGGEWEKIEEEQKNRSFPIPYNQTNKFQLANLPDNMNIV